MKKGNFQEKLYRFMYGRYGNDELNPFLSIFSIVLVVADIVFQFVPMHVIAKNIVFYAILASIIAIFAITTWRTLSKNVYKRRRENERFLNFSRSLKRIFTFNTSTKTRSHNQDSDVYIFRDCTKCSATLRLPRKKGRNKVKCPKCSHSFYVKSK